MPKIDADNKIMPSKNKSDWTKINFNFNVNINDPFDSNFEALTANPSIFNRRS
jgi:hypothetical protein